MTIHKIISEKGEIPRLCNGGSCPAAILADADTVIVQGYVPSDQERDQLTGPAGESFVKMSRATFEAIARQVLNS